MLVGLSSRTLVARTPGLVCVARTLGLTCVARTPGLACAARTLTTRVVVVGGGVGGLTAGLALAKFGYSVNILERKDAQAHLKPSRHYVGLWTPALLCLDKLKVLNNLELVYVKQSGYRSIKGRLLAYPSFNLDSFSSKNDNPSLAFVQEEELLETLKNIAVKHGATFSFNQDFTDISACPRSGCGVVRTADNTEYKADIVVAADGAKSNVRKRLYPSIQLRLRGYHVLRGFSPCYAGGGRVAEDSFQTWGPGVRFACVPVARGNAWFAAISSQKILEGLMDDPGLEEYFAGWHDPISELLRRTNESCGDISRVEAVAFPQVIPGGLSKIEPGLGVPVAFVGDAGHTLDPILAQGAGVAIQEAVDLASRIHKQLGLAWLDIPEQNLGGDWKKVMDKFKTVRLKRVETMLKKYEEGREKRLKKLHAISNLAQRVGHLENTGLCRARDLLIAGIPHAIKSPVFDKIIKESTS